MTEPKRPAIVPEGARWGTVVLGTGERVPAHVADDEVWIWYGSSFDLVWDSAWSQARFAIEWDGDDRWCSALWYQCRRLYEAEGTGYVELGEEPEPVTVIDVELGDEPENNDRTHPDSGSQVIDWEARRWEAFMRALGDHAPRLKWLSDDEMRAEVVEAKRLADVALAVYREGERDAD